MISIFIPAYNVEKQLFRVMTRIPEELWAELGHVYLINDGSTDGTAGVIAEIRDRFPRTRVITFDRNQGYGAVVKKGFELCRNDNCDHAVCLHGDGQYPPEKIREMVLAAQQGGLDIVQGSRHAAGTARQGNMPLYKIAAGKALGALENRVFGLSMTDYHSGFLCYSQRALKSIDPEKLSSSFDIDLEIIATARAARLNIGEIAIPTCYADEISMLNPVTYGFRVLGVLGKFISNRYHPVARHRTAADTSFCMQGN